MNNASNDEKAQLAETRFKEWLDQNNIPYWYIQQDLQTFSPSLKKYFIGRRPDYMILLPHLGFILVDVEYKKVREKYKDFCVDYDETVEYSNLQRNFNLEVWYALSNEESNFQTWYWIPVSKVLEKSKTQRFNSSVSKQDFVPLEIKDFTQIAIDDSLDRLFSKLLLGEFNRNK
ncbi:hypothetical protein M1563_01575 [Patescibacteria group bacterium]|nr:hypothetical protein [Patescibacteria group bacterium]MCL5409975.1 hypothetical protein [Patescibacteria group bacterium]